MLFLFFQENGDLWNKGKNTLCSFGGPHHESVETVCIAAKDFPESIVNPLFFSLIQ